MLGACFLICCRMLTAVIICLVSIDNEISGVCWIRVWKGFFDFQLINEIKIEKIVNFHFLCQHWIFNFNTKTKFWISNFKHKNKFWHYQFSIPIIHFEMNFLSSQKNVILLLFLRRNQIQCFSLFEFQKFKNWQKLLKIQF